MQLAPEFDPTLLSRIEDAGLNASAPPQQRWVDGWLLRTSPGKAKRARCINALAVGRLPLAEKLALCADAFREAQLPMVLRITPFTQPPELDAQLAALGMARFDDTRVMVLASLAALPTLPIPAGWRIEPATADDYAEAVGELRGSPPQQRRAQAQRLRASPVPYSGFLLRRAGGDTDGNTDGSVMGCAQFAREASLVGLYDVSIAPAHQGRGLARMLCAQLLQRAQGQGARCAYLQVEGDNLAARVVYHRLGFADGYGYHYRTADPAAA